FAEGWERIQSLFATARDKLTLKDVRAALPPDPPPPSEATLWRWLQRALADGLLQRSGTGHKNDPYRYWLPGREQEWRRVLEQLPPLPPLEDGLGWTDRGKLEGAADQFRRRKKPRGGTQAGQK